MIKVDIGDTVKIKVVGRFNDENGLIFEQNYEKYPYTYVYGTKKVICAIWYIS